MCGKFTAQAAWREVVDFSQPLTDSDSSGGGGGGGDEAGAGETYAYRVGGLVPVIVWDAMESRRRVIPMRWSIPDQNGAPKHIHARAETIDKLPTFRGSFLGGLRGIVVFETFNERKDTRRPDGKIAKQQWTIDPSDGQPRGFAFICMQVEVPDSPEPVWVCVMVTVPANELITRMIKSEEQDPRMPAILADGYDVWGTWIAEFGNDPVAAKALLQTVEGVTWQTFPEPKKPRKR